MSAVMQHGGGGGGGGGGGDAETQAPLQPKIPRAAFICGLAALAFTTGLTVACIPAFRKRQRSAAGAAGKGGIQFLSNAGLMRAPVGRERSTTTAATATMVPPPTRINRRIQETTTGLAQATRVTERSGPAAGKGKSSSSSSLSLSSSSSSSRDPHILDDPSPTLTPLHPEEHDVGPGTGAISPLFALGAFGIATGLVLVTAGATAVAVSKVLDVRDMDEFSAKMREYTGTLLPTMSEKLYSAPPPAAATRVDHPSSPFSITTLNTSSNSHSHGQHGGDVDVDVDVDELDPRRGVDEEDSIVRGWFGEVVREIEDDRRRIVEERRLKERERVV